MNKRQFAIRIENDLRNLFEKEREGDSQLFQADNIINNLFLVSVISLQKRKVSDDDINNYIETFDIIDCYESNKEENDILEKMYNKYIELYH